MAFGPRSRHTKSTSQNNNAKRGHVFPPFILGFDYAGIIEAAPTDNKSGLKKGDRVFGQSLGAFAEYIVTDEASVKRIPDNLSSEDAAGLVGQAVSYASVVHVARVKAGETVLVSGASGGLGSVCVAVVSLGIT